MLFFCNFVILESLISPIITHPLLLSLFQGSNLKQKSYLPESAEVKGSHMFSSYF